MVMTLPSLSAASRRNLPPLWRGDAQPAFDRTHPGRERSRIGGHNDRAGRCGKTRERHELAGVHPNTTIQSGLSSSTCLAVSACPWSIPVGTVGRLPHPCGLRCLGAVGVVTASNHILRATTYSGKRDSRPASAALPGSAREG